MIVNWKMMLITLMTKKIFILNIYTKYPRYVNDGNILKAESKDYAIVCANFGQVDGYEPMKESRSFHNNNCKIIVRSIYLRKCYLIVTTSQSRIIAIFEKINNVLPPIDGHR